MLCRKPFIKGGLAFSCGQCMPCRVQKRRVWTHRLLLEGNCHTDNCFITLTYDDENLPRLEDGRGILVPKDAQDFLKRLRKHYAPARFRFFCVGEYGDKSERPHYHMVLFNYPACTRVGGSKFDKSGHCCATCDVILDKWGLGHVHIGTLTAQSAGYVARYTTKKMTAADDMRLKGRPPEFARMSLKPGIGADFMHEVASTILQYSLYENDEEDVPNSLAHGKRQMPLGSYLKRKLREYVGKEPQAPESVLEAIMEELRPLQEEAQAEADFHFPNHTLAYGQIFRRKLKERGDGRVAQMEAKERIFKKRESI